MRQAQDLLNREARLTLHEAVQSPMYALEYVYILSDQRTKAATAHEPTGGIQSWAEFGDGLAKFVDALPATERRFLPLEWTNVPSNGEFITLYLMDLFHFKFVQQLGGAVGAIPKVDYSWSPQARDGEGKKLDIVIHSQLDRGWLWLNPKTGKHTLVAAAEGKHRYSRPSLPASQLVQAYNATTNNSDPVRLQLHQLCGHLASNKLKYGILYTDEVFWFAEYDAPRDVMRVSDSVGVAQGPPVTAAGALVYTAHLAVEAASGGGGSDSEGGTNCCWVGTLFGRGFGASGGGASQPPLQPGSAAAAAASQPQPCSAPADTDTTTVWLGPILGSGGTGTVHAARLPGAPDLVALKVAASNREAEARLLHEVTVYQQLAAQQGVIVPELLAAGMLQVPGGELPFLAIPLLGPTLHELEAMHLQLLPEQEQAVLSGLRGIHGVGFQHGDILPTNVAFDQNGRPLWIDFSQARPLDSDATVNAKERSSEERQCEHMLGALRAGVSDHQQQQRPPSSAVSALPRPPQRALQQRLRVLLRRAPCSPFRCVV